MRYRDLLIGAVCFAMGGWPYAAPCQIVPDVEGAGDAARRCHEASLSAGLAMPSRDTVCLHGQMTVELARDFANLDIEPGGWIVAHSEGGYGPAAVAIAEKIEALHMTLVVDGLCASACANWLFIAAQYKIVLPNSFTMWHRGPSRQAPLSYTLDERDHYLDFVRRSDALYARAGVDPDLMYWPSRTFDKARDTKPEGWDFTEDQLRTYGVRGVISLWRPQPGVPFIGPDGKTHTLDPPRQYR